MPVILYSAKGSNSSQRVEWALNYKDVTYQKIQVSSSELKTSYLEVNPFGYVPSLFIDDVILCESMAILEYVEERFAQCPLIGGNLVEKANVRRVCEYVNASIHSPQNRTVLQFWRSEIDEDTKKALRGEWISRSLLMLSPTICNESDFAVGQAFSLADIFVASIYKKAKQHGCEPVEFYEQHLEHIRSDKRVSAAEPTE